MRHRGPDAFEKSGPGNGKHAGNSVTHSCNPVEADGRDEWNGQAEDTRLPALPQLQRRADPSGIRQAIEAGSKVSIHVETNNPARKMYERLGIARL